MNSKISCRKESCTTTSHPLGCGQNTNVQDELPEQSDRIENDNEENDGQEGDLLDGEEYNGFTF